MTAPDLIAECADRLRPLLAEFDARVLNKAAQRIVDNDPAEQGRIKADVAKVLGVDSARGILGKDLFAELFPEEITQPQRLAQVIPFPVRAAGGAA